MFYHENGIFLRFLISGELKPTVKTLLISCLLIIGIFIGQTWAHIAYQRKELAKDSAGKYHDVCKSRIDGKLHGKSCTICVKKWALDHPDKDSYADKIIKYCEKIKGKDLLKFTDEEMRDCLMMML